MYKYKNKEIKKIYLNMIKYVKCIWENYSFRSN